MKNTTKRNTWSLIALCMALTMVFSLFGGITKVQAAELKVAPIFGFGGETYSFKSDATIDAIKKDIASKMKLDSEIDMVLLYGDEMGQTEISEVNGTTLYYNVVSAPRGLDQDSFYEIGDYVYLEKDKYYKYASVKRLLSEEAPTYDNTPVKIVEFYPDENLKHWYVDFSGIGIDLEQPEGIAFKAYRAPIGFRFVGGDGSSASNYYKLEAVFDTWVWQAGECIVSYNGSDTLIVNKDKSRKSGAMGEYANGVPDWFIDEQLAKTFKKIIVQYGVTKISRYSFIIATNLSSLSLPATLTSIDREAFEGCDALENVIFTRAKDGQQLVIDKNVFPGKAVIKYTGNANTKLFDGEKEVKEGDLLKNYNCKTLTWKASSTQVDVDNPSDVDTTKNALDMNSGLKVDQTGKVLNVSWGEVTDATSYEIFIAYSDEEFAKKATKTVKSNVNTVSIKKLNKKKLNVKKEFKVCVIAKSGKDVIGQSITVYAAGAKNAKYTNVKSVSITKSSVSLKAKKTAKIKAASELVDPKKEKLTSVSEFRYETSDETIAKVSTKGKITAVSKGKCYINVYSSNGFAGRIEVTVK